MANYEIQTLNDRVLKCSLFLNNQAMTYGEFLINLVNSQDFRSAFHEFLQSVPFTAYYWECPPVVANNLEQPFEFVLVRSESLEKIRGNPSPFKAYFKKGEAVASFMNLGKNAKLVVPKPLPATHNYAHLAAFVGTAPASQSDEFWKLVGSEAIAAINEKPIWLNTAGLGVHWLHVRLDSTPKYYKHKPYRIFELS